MHRELATNQWDLPHATDGSICPCGRAEADPLHGSILPQTAAEAEATVVTEKGS